MVNKNITIKRHPQPKPAPPTSSALRYLSLHLHGEILEHIVQLSDAALQLQDLIVPGLDLIQSLPRSFSITQDLNTTYLLGESWTAEPGTTFQGVIYEQQHKACRILRTSYLS